MKTTDRCFDLILQYADEYKPHKYNTKFSNTYYLTHITNVLGDIVSWKSLKKMNIICGDNKFHYKTINKTHLEWARNGVYEKAFNEIRRTTENCGVTQNNYIDGTLIINKSGIENIGYGCGESRKKRLSSSSIVCNEHGKLISNIINACYSKIINCIKIITTLPHDSRSTVPSIKNINTTEPYNQVGDAGFIIDRDILP